MSLLSLCTPCCFCLSSSPPPVREKRNNNALHMFCLDMPFVNITPLSMTQMISRSAVVWGLFCAPGQPQTMWHLLNLAKAWSKMWKTVHATFLCLSQVCLFFDGKNEKDKLPITFIKQFSVLQGTWPWGFKEGVHSLKLSCPVLIGAQYCCDWKLPACELGRVWGLCTSNYSGMKKLRKHPCSGGHTCVYVCSAASLFCPAYGTSWRYSRVWKCAVVPTLSILKNEDFVGKQHIFLSV